MSHDFDIFDMSAYVSSTSSCFSIRSVLFRMVRGDPGSRGRFQRRHGTSRPSPADGARAVPLPALTEATSDGSGTSPKAKGDNLSPESPIVSSCSMKMLKFCYYLIRLGM
jgi:hypothetical protein